MNKLLLLHVFAGLLMFAGLLSFISLSQTKCRRNDDKSNTAADAEKLRESFFMDVQTVMHYSGNVIAL
jgi:hypothetical protein